MVVYFRLVKKTLKLINWKLVLLLDLSVTSWKRDLVLYRCKLLENKPNMDNEMTFYCFIEVVAISVLFISLLIVQFHLLCLLFQKLSDIDV